MSPCNEFNPSVALASSNIPHHLTIIHVSTISDIRPIWDKEQTQFKSWQLGGSYIFPLISSLTKLVSFQQQTYKVALLQKGRSRKKNLHLKHFMRQSLKFQDKLYKLPHFKMHSINWINPSSKFRFEIFSKPSSPVPLTSLLTIETFQ